MAFLPQTSSHAADPGGALPPPIVFTVEPEEGGKFVYMRVPPTTAIGNPSNLLGLNVSAVNNGTGTERLNTIRIRFPGFPDLTTDLVRDESFAQGETKSLYMEPEESIQLPEPPPPTVVFDLLFDGYSMPKSITRSLAPYVAPGGFFLFPGNAKDLPAEHYWSHKERHTGGGQYFAYDMKVYGRDPLGQTFTPIKTGGSEAVNTDYRAWNTPIYAMQDGVVITADTDLENNPAPGMRSVQRMADDLAGSITDVKMTQLSSSRAASVLRLPSNALKIIVWDTQAQGRQIFRRGDAQGEDIAKIATDALSDSNLVTAVVLAGGSLRIIVWGISSDGQTVTRLCAVDEAGAHEVSMARLSSSRFATAVQTDDGRLRLIVWEVSADRTSVYVLSHWDAGTASSVSVSALSSTRLVTTLRDGGGDLKCIVWDVPDNGTTIDRRGDSVGDAISKAVSLKTTASEFVTAARTAAGTLSVIRWSVSDDGLTLGQEAAGSGGQIEDVSAAMASGESVMTAIITGSGEYKNILWTYPEMTRYGEAVAGATDRMDIAQLDSSLLMTGIRTAEGKLKVMTWLCGSGGGNSLRILHGNCIVLYAHFNSGTVNPAVAFPGAHVYAGQFLGRLGNSGSSSNPHLHIHSTRVSSLAKAADLIEQARTDDIPYIGYRPIVWHGAQTMRLDGIQPGGLANQFNASHFSTMTGHGVYFLEYGILPNWQLPAEPALTIRSSSNSATVEWTGGGQRLQSNDDVSSGRWLDFPAGTVSPVRVSTREGRQFFRLMRDSSQLSDFGIEATGKIHE